MQLFNLLKQAQQNNGPDESSDKGGTDADRARRAKKQDSHAESKEEEFISHNDVKRGDDSDDNLIMVASNYNHQHQSPPQYHHNNIVQDRIEEVEDEHEQNTFSDQDAEEQAYDSDAAAQAQARANDSENRRREHRKQDNSPRRRTMQRDSKESAGFINEARSSQVKRSLDSFVQRSFEQSKGMTCIFAPENVEPSSPTLDQQQMLDDSLDRFSPRPAPLIQTTHQAPIDIYLDEDSPTAVVVKNSKANAFVEPESPSAAVSPRQPRQPSNDQLAQGAGAASEASSPVQLLKKSQRNYFRRDQENKALVNQMRRTMTESNHSSSLQGDIAKPAVADEDTGAQQRPAQAQKDISQHDQNHGGQHEHHGSRHDQDASKNSRRNRGSESPSSGSGDDDQLVSSSQQWHDIKMVENGESDSQELVIENLEHLQESTALIVTRDLQTGNFKIGIQQDAGGVANASDIVSNAARSQITSTASQNAGSGLKKIKLRGKFGGSGASPPQLQTSVLPAAGAAKYRTISVNSESGRNKMEPQNKYKTFQDPAGGAQHEAIGSGLAEGESSTGGGGVPPFRSIRRNRDSASDNKRLRNEQLEIRSHIQSAQAEEMIRKSRDSQKKQPIAGGSPATLGYVKVIDPLQAAAKQKITDPNDRSDSKLGPTMVFNNKAGPAVHLNNNVFAGDGGGNAMPSGGLAAVASQSQYQKSTHRANSSVHSREGGAAAAYQHPFRTPDIKQSNTAVSLKLGGQQQPEQLSRFGGFGAGGNPQHLQTLQAQGASKKDFQALKQGVVGTGNKYQAMHELPLYVEQDTSNVVQVDLLSSEQQMMLHMPQAAPPITELEEGQHLLEVPHSRASVISRRSNTDMKGENLVKFQHQVPPAGADKEIISPLKQMSPPLSPATTTGMLIPNNLLLQQQQQQLHEEQQTAASPARREALVDAVSSTPQHHPSKQRLPNEKQEKSDTDRAAGADLVDNLHHSHPAHPVSPSRQSPSRTDTAFYDGKAQLQMKSATSEAKKQASPSHQRQMSEIGAAPDDNNVAGPDIKASLMSEHNYHTATEDAGDGYFPQILKYTENAPQESILSRDNYSTSNHPSMISGVPPKRKPIQQSQNILGGDSNKKQHTRQQSSVDLQARSNNGGGTTSPGMVGSGPEGKLPLSIMNQNVARVEKQNPSLSKASVLSHSVQQDEEEGSALDVNQRASSGGLGHVTEEEAGRSAAVISPLVKDGSSYNIATSDITAIPGKKQPRAKPGDQHQAKSGPESPSQQMVPALDMATVQNPKAGQVLSPKTGTEKSLKKQASKESVRSSQHIINKTLRESQRLSKLSATQRSKASLQSRISKNSSTAAHQRAGPAGSTARAQSMLPSLTAKDSALKSSSRTQQQQQLQKQLKQKSERSTTMPMQGNHNNMSATRSKAKASQQSSMVAEGSGAPPLKPVRLPSVQSPQPSMAVGQHLASASRRSNQQVFPGGQQMNAAALAGASMRSSPKQGQMSPRNADNQSMLDTMAQNQQNAMISDGEKPIMKYMEASDAEQKSYPLKYFKGQDLELYYMEKQLKPGVEREIKEGFFEIRKKFGEGQAAGEEVQVYVSHLCLHNYHPIFCKFNLDVVKTILNFSQIIYLNKGQVLYEQGYNDRYLYVILFGKLRLSQHETDQPIGSPLNIGWTVGEEILFKSDRKANGGNRTERCRSLCESCVLGIEKRSLAQIKRTLVEKGQAEEFVKLEVVLRGNYLVKKAWRA